MRSLFVILLCCQIVSNNVFAAEVIRIPLLFEHYFHHSEEHGDVSDFMEFLNMHYGDDGRLHTMPQEEEDKNLPFRSDDNCVHTHVALNVTMPATAALVCPARKPALVFTTVGADFQSQHISRIWQPPRF